MFLSLSTADYRDQWACVSLTDTDGKVFHLDIVRMTELTSLPGVDFPDGNPVVYLSVVDQDVDRLKLAQRMLSNLPGRGMADWQWKILAVVKSWNGASRRHGFPVMCNETGEQWASAAACANAHNLTYVQLVRHLKNQVGYKTVKGRTYRRIT